MVVALLALVIGCGGGGGGGGGTTSLNGGQNGGQNGSTAGTLSSFQVTAYSGVNGGSMVSTQSLIVGQAVQLKVTARDQNNNLVVLATNGWTITAPSNIATVTSAGVLTVTGATTNTTYVIHGSYSGNAVTAPLATVAAQDFVTGQVKDASSTGIENVLVTFYNASGTQVGSAYTARDGTFLGSVPGSTTRFTINLAASDPAPSNYYAQFGFNSEEYLDGTSCLAPLSVTPNSSNPVSLPSPIEPDIKTVGGTPPPPPTGCVGG